MSGFVDFSITQNLCSIDSVCPARLICLLGYCRFQTQKAIAQK
ncbi:hypothetical protein [uncultured Helicobacter sp.]